MSKKSHHLQSNKGMSLCVMADATEAKLYKEEIHMKERIPTPIREVEDLASATECTGLVPAAIQTQEEAEEYAELYAIHRQKPAWTKEENGKPEQRGK